MVEENNNSIKPIRLILHIGAGKTGTSSIQKALQHNRNVLKENGVDYLGLMFENVDQRLYDWQKPSAIEIFHSLPQEEIDKAIYVILQAIVEKARINNIHTLIWSNESFFNRSDKLFPALKKLELLGVEIKFLAYVRKYDSWAKSAYIQWGIKHKTNEGGILPFNEWIKTRLPQFYVPLKRIEDVFPKILHVRNMDATNDVVEDFYHFLKLPITDLKLIRTNESPNNVELLLRAVFNNSFHGQVLPRRFDNFIFKNKPIQKTPTEYLKGYLPTEKDLNEVLSSTEEDRVLLNTLLNQQKQQEIKNEPLVFKPIEVNTEKLLMTLSEIVLEQARRISKLEDRLKD